MPGIVQGMLAIRFSCMKVFHLVHLKTCHHNNAIWLHNKHAAKTIIDTCSIQCDSGKLTISNAVLAIMDPQESRFLLGSSLVDLIFSLHGLSAGLAPLHHSCSINSFRRSLHHNNAIWLCNKHKAIMYRYNYTCSIRCDSGKLITV